MIELCNSFIADDAASGCRREPTDKESAPLDAPHSTLDAQLSTPTSVMEPGSTRAYLRGKCDPAVAITRDLA